MFYVIILKKTWRIYQNDKLKINKNNITFIIEPSLIPIFSILSLFGEIIFIIIKI